MGCGFGHAVLQLQVVGLGPVVRCGGFCVVCSVRFDGGDGAGRSVDPDDLAVVESRHGTLAPDDGGQGVLTGDDRRMG